MTNLGDFALSRKAWRKPLREVFKDGSLPCAPKRYRPAARRARPIDASAPPVGFHCIVRSRV